MEGGKCLGGVVLGRKERNWVRSGWPGGCACRKALEKHESLICARKLGQSETTDSPANNSQVFRVLQFLTISVLVSLHFKHETHTSECVKTVGQKAKGILWEKICLEGCQ